ncbi:MAG: PRC-barrel domain containing protein [Acidimicrobiia bacterium]|nr:PRC-barrel domain containing protein [Acidimicrobiia bacterium]
MTNVWSQRDPMWTQEGDLVGYDVEATDGSIGKIDASSYATGTESTDYNHVVVDTGWWIFGHKRLIPAGSITGVDHENQRVMVNLTKDQIKDAPDYMEADWNDDSRQAHETYYGQFPY